MVGVNYSYFKKKLAKTPPSVGGSKPLIKQPAKAPPPIQSIPFPQPDPVASMALVGDYPFLRSYQVDAARRMKTMRRCLACMDLGLGKTLTTITLLVDLEQSGHLGKTLVVAPPRVAREVWEQEIRKWNHSKHLRVSRVLGTPKQRVKALDADADIYLLSFESLDWLMTHHDSAQLLWKFENVVIDESYFAKSFSTLRWKALKRIHHLPVRIFLLSARPAANGLMDLWAQIYLIDGGARLGKYFTKFREKYFYPCDPNGWSWSLKEGSDEKIWAAISDICFVMRSQDYLDMPPLTFNRIHVSLPPAAQKAYKEMRRKTLLRFESGTVSAATQAVLVNKLQQLANGFLYTDGDPLFIHDEKISALKEIYESAAGAPILVAYNYSEDKDRILKAFPDARTLDSKNAVNDFNANKIPMLVMHPASGGHGLNLQLGGASIIVFVGPIYSLDQHDQLIARLYRQGQVNGVVVHYLMARDTIDERIMEIIEKKDAGQNALLNALKVDINAP